MVEGTALEMRHTGNRIEGSNPSPVRQLTFVGARRALAKALFPQLRVPALGITNRQDFKSGPLTRTADHSRHIPFIISIEV